MVLTYTSFIYAKYYVLFVILLRIDVYVINNEKYYNNNIQLEKENGICLNYLCKILNILFFF